MKKEVLLTGFGGQGIVLAGQILGKAASLLDGKESTLTQSYGPEARGGACSAQVIISDSPIHFPYVHNPDILVCMSRGGYEKYGPDLVADGTLIVDQDLVHPGADAAAAGFFAIPATRIAEELGRKMMANIVMLGFVTAVSALASPDAMRRSVSDSVPKGTQQANIAAFDKGYEFGRAVLKSRQKKAAAKQGAAQ